MIISENQRPSVAISGHQRDTHLRAHGEEALKHPLARLLAEDGLVVNDGVDARAELVDLVGGEIAHDGAQQLWRRGQGGQGG